MLLHASVCFLQESQTPIKICEKINRNSLVIAASIQKKGTVDPFWDLFQEIRIREEAGRPLWTVPITHR